MSDLKLTSVKVHEDLYQEFKILSVRYKFSFQKLADRAIFLYLTDEDFRARIHKTTNITLED